MCPHGFRNETLCSLCHQSRETKNHHPNNDISPETEEELKEFTRDLEENDD